MKKIFSLITCLLLSCALNAQERIKMEKAGGIYKIPCEVNGLRMKDSFAGRTTLIKYYTDNKEYVKARDLCNGLLNEHL